MITVLAREHDNTAYNIYGLQRYIRTEDGVAVFDTPLKARVSACLRKLSLDYNYDVEKRFWIYGTPIRITVPFEVEYNDKKYWIFVQKPQRVSQDSITFMKDLSLISETDEGRYVKILMLSEEAIQNFKMQPSKFKLDAHEKKIYNKLTTIFYVRNPHKYKIRYLNEVKSQGYGVAQDPESLLTVLAHVFRREELLPEIFKELSADEYNSPFSGAISLRQSEQAKSQ